MSIPAFVRSLLAAVGSAALCLAVSASSAQAASAPSQAPATSETIDSASKRTAALLESPFGGGGHGGRDHGHGNGHDDHGEGNGFGHDHDPPAPPPPPPPPPPAPPGMTASDPVPEHEPVLQAMVVSGQATHLETSTASGAQIEVDVPAGGLPSGAFVTLSEVDRESRESSECSPPAATLRLVKFDVTATARAGSPITGDFGAPVQMAVRLPAAALPPTTSATSVAIAYCDGAEWVAVDAAVTRGADGSIIATFATEHFSSFALMRQSAEATACCFSMVTWRGLSGTSVNQVLSLAPAGSTIYVMNSSGHWVPVGGLTKLKNGQPYLVRWP